MIGIIYPKDDWTAADIAIKIKALGASSDLKVYSTPKNTMRDEEEIKMKLRKVNSAIFIAYDRVHLQNLDRDTIWELKFLLERNIPIFSIVPEGMEEVLINIGLPKEHIYAYEPNNMTAFKNTINSILEEMGDREKEGGEGLGELLALLALLGIGAFFLYLLFGKKE